MTQKELVVLVAEKTGLSRKDADAAVRETFDAIANTIANKDSVRINGFGTFKYEESSARQGRNPRTEEVIDIPARAKLKFKVAKPLDERMKAIKL